ncbi:asparagine synthetase [Candidatus Micrarchaeota archaeon]|nr:asparagine synthetase [Candidatus Micrarchaeota archaeon]
MPKKSIEHIQRKEMADILKVQSAAMKAVQDYLWEKGILLSSPVILSTITDPLNHDVEDSSLKYRGQKLELTKSMILHKQLAVGALDAKGIYIVSPNVRLEGDHTSLSGRHLLEFSQVDIELRDASSEDFRKLIEGLYTHVIRYVKESCAPELARLGRNLKVPTEYKVFKSDELREKYGDRFEEVVSGMEKSPFWVLSHYREFYDKQDKESGEHINYDLVYPEGYGEALSGGEREHEYGRILEKMRERKNSEDAFAPYLQIAQMGILRPSAGGGFGVERMVRFLCGKQHVRDVILFPKVPGEKVVF